MEEDNKAAIKSGHCGSFAQLFSNDDGRLSTTNTIQMLASITLCGGFFAAMFFDLTVPGELALIIAGMATLTATSKGVVTTHRSDKDE